MCVCLCVCVSVCLCVGVSCFLRMSLSACLGCPASKPVGASTITSALLIASVFRAPALSATLHDTAGQSDSVRTTTISDSGSLEALRHPFDLSVEACFLIALIITALSIVACARLSSCAYWLPEAFFYPLLVTDDELAWEPTSRQLRGLRPSLEASHTFLPRFHTIQLHGAVTSSSGCCFCFCCC